MANSKKRRNAAKGLRYAAQMDSRQAVLQACIDTGKTVQYETPASVADVQRQRGKTMKAGTSTTFIYNVRMEHKYGTGHRTRVYRAARQSN